MVSSGGWIDGSKVSKKIWLRILAQFNRMGLSIILFTNPGILKISCIFYFNLFHMLAYFHPVLDSCGCCTKLSQIHWVKTTPIYSPSVLECNLFSFSSPSVWIPCVSGKILLPAASRFWQLLPFLGILGLWLHPPNLCPSSRSCHFCVSVVKAPLFLFHKDICDGFRGHLENSEWSPHAKILINHIAKTFFFLR